MISRMPRQTTRPQRGKGGKAASFLLSTKWHGYFTSQPLGCTDAHEGEAAISFPM
jgi:hypothetical protein